MCAVTHFTKRHGDSLAGSPTHPTSAVSDFSHSLERLTRRFPGARFRGRNPDQTVLFCCLIKLCIMPPSMAVKKKTARRRPRGCVIGYARVSTSDQDLASQIDALKKHGYGKDHIFVDKASGARSKRPGLAACLEELQQGDVLLVFRLLHAASSHSRRSTARARHQLSIGDGAIDGITQAEIAPI